MSADAAPSGAVDAPPPPVTLPPVPVRALLLAGVAAGLLAGTSSTTFTLLTGRSLWSNHADGSATWSYPLLMNQGWWISWALLTAAIFRVADRFPLNRESWRRRLPVHFVAGTLAVAAHGVCVSAVRSVLQPIYGIEHPFWPGFVEQVLRSYSWDLTYYAAAVGLRHAMAYYAALRDREVRAAELETRLVEAQLQALQRQLHPHFLFNTLHAISALVRRDPVAAEEMIERLGDLLRLTLNRVGAQEVTLSEELDYLDVYLEIEKIHFGSRLQVRCTVDPEARDALVPYLVLQPLVENAITHGIGPRLAPGTVEIEARLEGDRLRLIVADTGVGIDWACLTRVRRGVGLSNTQARLERLYGPRQRFALAPRPGGGVIVEIEIPARIAARPAAAAPAAEAFA